ncbi:MAG: 2-C-methyl-D-erythritol 2,4-cyclodiphosphate synthase [Ferrimicrobium sp.]
MSVATLVVAAGRGERFGAPKHSVALGGQSVLSRAVAAALAVSALVVVALPEGEVLPVSGDGVVYLHGGTTRSASVRAALAAVPSDTAYILIHDVARPLAPRDVFDRVLGALHHGADAVVPVVAMADTVKRIVDGVVVETIPRAELGCAQTPQGFQAAVLRAIHEGSPEDTDDASLAERGGYRVVSVSGDERAMKITQTQDLSVLAVRAGMIQLPRIGLGLDVHPTSLDPTRELRLGGTAIPGPGLDGHSDADCLAHAVADAMLGAAGVGGIGDIFPDSDPALAGADSLELLRRVDSRVRALGLRVVQIDATVVAERPRLAPYLVEMGDRIGEVVQASVCVKAKHPEGIGALGAGDGIAAVAIAVLVS